MTAVLGAVTREDTRQGPSEAKSHRQKIFSSLLVTQSGTAYSGRELKRSCQVFPKTLLSCYMKFPILQPPQEISLQGIFHFVAHAPRLCLRTS